MKAAFWTDTELIRQFSRDERLFYQGLWQLADDSGCLDNDPWAFKLHLFPLDLDILPTILADWTQKLIDAKKLLPYEMGHKQCVFLVNFHKHQTMKNPAAPDVPLPSWLTWTTYPSNSRTGFYSVDQTKIPDTYAILTPSLQKTYDCLPREIEHEHEEEREHEGEEEREHESKVRCAAPPGAEKQLNPPRKDSHKQDETPDGFDLFWEAYPRKVAKTPALIAYSKATKSGADPPAIIYGAKNYAVECRLCGREVQFICHPTTFLNQCRWQDYQVQPVPTDFAPRIVERPPPKGGRLVDRSVMNEPDGQIAAHMAASAEEARQYSEALHGPPMAIEDIDRLYEEKDRERRNDGNAGIA